MLHALRLASEHTLVFVHDFYADDPGRTSFTRGYYKVVRSFYKYVRRQHRMVVLRPIRTALSMAKHNHSLFFAAYEALLSRASNYIR